MGSDDEALDGWGFKDTRFEVQPDDSVILTGSRYALSGHRLPDLLPWFSGKLGVKLTYAEQSQNQYPPAVAESKLPPALRQALLEAVGADGLTTDAALRLRHGHGHTASEIWAIRYSQPLRPADAVVFPASAEQVQRVIELAVAHDATVIPFGGGTNVTKALMIPLDEQRPVISLDLRRMKRCLRLDLEDHAAVFEAGITGRELEATLRPKGLTMGHEPDSLEFSTLGGWIATNASGMKKNRYGNIEDIVLDIAAVSSSGLITRPAALPRESLGVRPLQYFLGSEGNLGVITSATIKVKSLPEVQLYGSVIFADMKVGIAFLHDLQRSGHVPASVRLVDNTQFQFGLALKPERRGALAALKSRMEKYVVTRLKGFDPAQMCVVTLVYEGSRKEVSLQQSIVRTLQKKYGGMAAGSANGERGYQLTFAIAYIRDLAFAFQTIAESFETSVPWSKAYELYRRVSERVTSEHQRLGLPGRPFFTGRVTQLYETGVCVYFYLGFHAASVADPVAAYEALEHAARDEILLAGGALSHHHGIGKIREAFLPRVYSPAALQLNQSLKRALDPANTFGAGNHGVRGVPA